MILNHVTWIALIGFSVFARDLPHRLPDTDRTVKFLNQKKSRPVTYAAHSPPVVDSPIPTAGDG